MTATAASSEFATEYTFEIGYSGFPLNTNLQVLLLEAVFFTAPVCATKLLCFHGSLDSGIQSNSWALELCCTEWIKAGSHLV